MITVKWILIQITFLHFHLVQMIVGMILCNYDFRIYSLEILDTMLVLANILLNSASRQLQLAPAEVLGSRNLNFPRTPKLQKK